MRYIILSLVLICPAAYAQSIEYDFTGTVTSDVFSGTPLPSGPTNNVSGFYGNGVGSQVSGSFSVDSNGFATTSALPSLDSFGTVTQSPFSVSINGIDKNVVNLTTSFTISSGSMRVSESQSYEIPSGPTAGSYAYSFLTTVGDLIVTELTPNGPVTVVGAPEIDPASAASGLTLFFGMLLVLRSRRTAKADSTTA